MSVPFLLLFKRTEREREICMRGEGGGLGGGVGGWVGGRAGKRRERDAFKEVDEVWTRTEEERLLGVADRVYVCVSDTEGYRCISSLSSCLAAENRWRQALSRLLSSTPLSLSLSIFGLSLPFLLSSVSLPLPPLFSSSPLFIGLFTHRSDASAAGIKAGARGAVCS